MAKQAWRVMNDLHSLVACILKGKYFPRANFLEAKVKDGCSYLWKSLAWGRDLIRNGSRGWLGRVYSLMHLMMHGCLAHHLHSELSRLSLAIWLWFMILFVGKGFGMKPN